MKVKVFLICVVSVTMTATIVAQRGYGYSRTGDHLYEDGRYNEAETQYRKALEADPEARTAYNLGNSIFLQDRIPEAIAEYEKVILSSDNPEVRQRAFYNLGNAHFQNNAFGESIKAYKEALKINPEDIDAKKNLMLAMRMLQQQQKQQQQNQQQEEQQQQQQNQQDQQQQDQNQNQQEQQQEQQQKEDVSKEEAKEILKAIEREDQRVQEKLKKSSGKSTPPVKDWWS